MTAPSSSYYTHIMKYESMFTDEFGMDAIMAVGFNASLERL